MSNTTDESILTPYSTVEPFIGELPAWLDEYNGQRISAYTAYEKMYWSADQAFKLIRRNDDGRPIYVPKPKMIVDTTSYYLMKGMQVSVEDPEKSKELYDFIQNFCKRERFYSRFKVAKHAGVIRGDWVLHITADPNKDEGRRISINSVDPASYFPEYDTDDLDKRTGARLIEQQVHPDDPTKTVVKVLRYWQNYDPVTGKRISPLVWREEVLWELEGWDNPRRQKKVRELIPAAPLPADITSIPLYHFKNAEFDGFDFGNSELKGYERVFQAIDQAISDEEISLALVGLGVYATDAGRPKNSRGEEVDWIVAPGTVWEMPGATMVKRLEGITSVTPVLDHVHYLEGALLDASGTSEVALGRIDSQTAESGIALAIKFIPTLAKIEDRDVSGVEVLTQLWFDWKFWVKAYESSDFTQTDISIVLGEKLPINRPQIIDELNNLLDRKVISRKYYRQQIVARLGYVMDVEAMEKQMIEEQVELQRATLEVQNEQFGSSGGSNSDTRNSQNQPVGAGDTLPRQNQSNNRNRTNESNGTEVQK